MKYELSIIIVSWNVKDLLKRCLESIYANQGELNLEVIVVDNASADGTDEMVKQDFPGVQLFANHANLGFAAASNQGYRASSGDNILFLNPDTEILRGALGRSLQFLANNDKVGVCGCRLLNSDKTTQASVRRFPTLTAILLIITKIAKILPNLPPLNRYLSKDFDYNKAAEVDQVAGAFFLTKRKVLIQVGLFDEKFYIWFEEVDLCKRIKDAGYQVWYFPLAEVIHHGAQSFKKQLTVKNQINFISSAWHYFNKHGFK